MAAIKRLERLSAPLLNHALREAARSRGLTNVFNPSIATVGATQVAAFRALSEDGRKPFRAYLFTFAGDGAGMIVDLTSHAAEFGVAPVADPKAFSLGEELFVTFNTGHPADRSQANSLYIMRVAPTLGAPQHCEVPDVARQRVEKNWGFYDDGQRLAGFYSISPIRALSLVDGDLASPDQPLRFSVDGLGNGTNPPALSMGTQPILLADRVVLIAHEKIKLYRKRAYFGRLIEVRTPDAVTRVSRLRLVHSFRDALPQRDTHNKFLLSATYFSGICATPEGKLVLSYGVNDRTFNFAEVEESDLW